MLKEPAETQRIEDIISELKESINWNRVFLKIDEDHFIKGIPGNCNIGDYFEFQRKIASLEQLPDGYIVYHFHTHENGDHLVHLLDIDLHQEGFEKLVTAGVLY